MSMMVHLSSDNLDVSGSWLLKTTTLDPSHVTLADSYFGLKRYPSTHPSRAEYRSCMHILAGFARAKLNTIIFRLSSSRLLTAYAMSALFAQSSSSALCLRAKNLAILVFP